MGIGDLGCNTSDGEHMWEWLAAGHKQCRVCKQEEIQHAPVVDKKPTQRVPDREEVYEAWMRVQHLREELQRAESAHAHLVEARYHERPIHLG